MKTKKSGSASTVNVSVRLGVNEYKLLNYIAKKLNISKSKAINMLMNMPSLKKKLSQTKASNEVLFKVNSSLIELSNAIKDNYVQYDDVIEEVKKLRQLLK